MLAEAPQLERLVDDVEIRRAAAKTLKGYLTPCRTKSRPTSSIFFEDTCAALENDEFKRLELIGFRG